MTVLNAVDLTRLRQRPHQTKLWLSIYQPKTRFSASYASGTDDDTKVYYGSVTTGVYGNIQPNSTLLVGTTPGAWDIGKIRVKSATGTYMMVAPNDDIAWAGGQYLTVLDLHEVYPKYVKLDEGMIDADDDSPMYIDWDTIYTNQNSLLGTQVCMGGNYAGFVEDSVYYSSSGTYNVKGEAISAYEWWFEGATVTGSTSADPGYISYPDPGNYITRLKTTSSGGAVNVGYRHVSIYNHSTKKPIMNWGMETLAGSRDEGGYSGEIWVKEILPNLLENSIVVIFAEDEYYGGDKVSLGGNQINRERIVFSGYILKDSIVYDYRTSTTSFGVGSITEIMKEKEGTAYDLDDATTATKWQHIQDMSIKKALYQNFMWYSTVGEVCDVRYIMDDAVVEFFECGMSSLYDAVNEYLQNKIYGQLVSDRQGTIFIQAGINITHNATGVYPVCMELQKQDWVEEPSIVIAQNNEVSYIEMGGYYYEGIPSAPGMNASVPFTSNAPGNIKAYSGKPEAAVSGLTIASQADLNQKTGDHFAYINAKYPETNIKLAGNYRNIELAPIEQILVTVNREDTHRQIVLSRHPFHVQSMGMSYTPDKASILMETTLHEITRSKADGQTLPIPETPDENPSTLSPLPDFGFADFPFGFSSYSNVTILSPGDAAPQCAWETDAGENGAWSLGYKGTMLSTDDITTRLRYGFFYRGTSYDHPTTYTIQGKWYVRNTTGSSIGAWVETNDDTMYEIYLCDNLGNRLGQAVKDPVIGNGRLRTGRFNVANGLNVRSIEIAMREESNPITTVDWSPYTFYTADAFKWKYIPSGVELEDIVQRDFYFGFSANFQGGSFFTPRVGGSYPYNTWWDVYMSIEATGAVDPEGTPLSPKINWLNGWYFDAGGVLGIDTTAPLWKGWNTLAYPAYIPVGSRTYYAQWHPTGAGDRVLTTYFDGSMTGGYWCRTRWKTITTLKLKASRMFVLDNFSLWNICNGGSI